MPASRLESILAIQLHALGFPVPEREYRFHPQRKWRFDFAWPTQRLALEVEGGLHRGGRHVRPVGFEADCEKYNAAALAGWTLLRVTPAMIRDGRAHQWVEAAFGHWHREDQP